MYVCVMCQGCVGWTIGRYMCVCLYVLMGMCVYVCGGVGGCMYVYVSWFCLCWRCTRAGTSADPDVVLSRRAFWVQVT